MSDGPPFVIELTSVTKDFARDGKRVRAVTDIDLAIRPGEFVAVLGPSGCGKSTLLNMIAGLMRPSSGQILFNGEPVPEPNTYAGYVTQKDNLMPWRTTARNVGIALEIKRTPADERDRRIQGVLDLVGLTGFEESYPTELSGGMKKRAALARTLIYRPEVILADEPFGALDAQLKLLMWGEFLRIWSEGERKTVVFVTHDVEEAVILSDRVVLLSSRPGRVTVDRVIELARPRDVFRMRFDPAFTALQHELWNSLGIGQ